MKQKFIEGTNKQYSIREDGTIINHYRKRSNGIIAYKDNILTPYFHKTTRAVVIKLRANNKSITPCVKKLVMNTFGEVKNDKKWILVHKDGDIYNCAYSNLEYKYKDICNNNNYGRPLTKEESQVVNRLGSKRHATNITKSYIAGILKISVKDLPDDLYQFYKAKIKLERLIKTKRNGKN